MPHFVTHLYTFIVLYVAYVVWVVGASYLKMLRCPGLPYHRFNDTIHDNSGMNLENKKIVLRLLHGVIDESLKI